MTEPLAAVQNYDELQVAMRAIADTRKLSRDEIDRISGLPKGFAAKVLSPVPTKRLGPDTIGPMCWALGIKLQVIEDPRAMEMFTAQGDKRVEWRALNAAMHSGAVHFKISLRKLRQNGRKGGKSSRSFVGKRLAKKLARKAARARWHKPKPNAPKCSGPAPHATDSAAHVPNTSPAIAQPSPAPAVPPRHSAGTGAL